MILLIFFIILMFVIILFIYNSTPKKMNESMKIITPSKHNNKKIVIIGGGWAGISAAYLLSKNKNFEVIIIEKEDKIGGQASSSFRKSCNVEYSWRVYFDLYHCVKKILKDANLLGKLCQINPTIITDNKNSLPIDKIFDNKNIYQILKYYDVDNMTIIKLLYLLTLPQNILEKFYNNTCFVEYLNNYDIFKLLAGPVLGFDPKKVCIPTVLNLTRNKLSSKTLGYKDYHVTCGPPNDELFNYLSDYLKSNKITILLNTECFEINKIYNEKILVKTNCGNIECDEVIISSSLYSLTKLMAKFKNKDLNKKLYELKSCLQNYFSMNLYLSEELGPNHNYIILKEPWQPIIETKRQKLWKSYIKKYCNPKIKDVWNVDVFDFYPGHNGKILRDCSIKEVINETMNQIKNDKYISSLRSKAGKSINDLILGQEIHNFWKEKNGKIYTTNPKFSINMNAYENLLDYNYKSIGHNIWFAAYYCKPSFRFGASMDNSSFIGLNCGKLIYEKYGISIPNDIDDVLKKYNN